MNLQNPMLTKTWRSLTTRFQGWVLLPIIYVGLGLVILIAQAIDGHLTRGIGWFAVIAVVGALYAFGGHFEIIRQARGDFADERDASINRRAMATTGTTLVVVLTACMVFKLARGESPDPYSELMAVGGVSYVAALLLLRFRS